MAVSFVGQAVYTNDSAGLGFFGGSVTLPTAGGDAVQTNDWIYMVWSNVANTGDTIDTETYSFPGWQQVQLRQVVGSTINGLYRRKRSSGDGSYSVSLTLGRQWMAAFFWVRGGSDSHRIGTRKTRSDAPTSSTVNNALPVASTFAEDLMVAWSLERTLAGEGTAPTVGGASLAVYQPETANNTCTLMLATQIQAGDGDTTEVIFTYPNPQVLNGVAQQIIIPLPSVAPPPPPVDANADFIGSMSVHNDTSGFGFFGGTVTLPTTGDNAVLTDDWIYMVWSNVINTGDTPDTETYSFPGWEQVEARVVVGSVINGLYRRKRGAADGGYSIGLTLGRQWMAAFFWVRGAIDLQARSVRTSRSVDMINVAPATAGVKSNDLVVAWSVERTTAAEATTPTITGADLLLYQAQQNNNTTTIMLAGLAQPTAGSTSDITFTYPNTQLLNGAAQQIIFTIPTPVVETYVWDGTALVESQMNTWDGATLTPAEGAGYHSGTYTIANLLADNPLFAAHRGSGGNWPEHTMRSYTGAVMWGMKAIEISVQRTSDGVFVTGHDTSTLRVTGVDYTVRDTPLATIQGLTVGAGDTDNVSQPGQPMPLLTDVLDRYAGTHVIFIEPKDPAANFEIALLNLMDTYASSTSHFIYKTYINSPYMDDAKARGYTTWGYVLDEPAHWNNLATLAANPNTDMIGVFRTMSDAQVATVVNAADVNGKRTIMWDIRNLTDYNRALSFGITGMMTSNIRVVLPMFP